LYANTVLRGGAMELHGGTVAATRPIEVIEELMPLEHIRLSLNLQERISKITLEPQEVEMNFEQREGRIVLEIPKVVCHQMVVCHYQT
jgi:hypothetical protein